MDDTPASDGGSAPDLDALLLRTARGDQRAFSDFCDQTASRVLGLVRRLLIDSAQAGEVAQEIFLDALQSAGKTYELWYIRDGAATRAGTMDSSGKLATWRVFSGTMTAGDTVVMTVERVEARSSRRRSRSS